MMLVLELIWVSCCRKSILMTRKKSSGTATQLFNSSRAQQQSSGLFRNENTRNWRILFFWELF